MAAGLVKELMMEPLNGYWLLSRSRRLLMLMVSNLLYVVFTSKFYHNFIK